MNCFCNQIDIKKFFGVFKVFHWVSCNRIHSLSIHCRLLSNILHSLSTYKAQDQALLPLIMSPRPLFALSLSFHVLQPAYIDLCFTSSNGIMPMDITQGHHVLARVWQSLQR